MKLYMATANILDIAYGDIVLAQKIEPRLAVGPSRWVIVGRKGMSTEWLYASDLVLL